MILEILVHAHLISTGKGIPKVDQKTLEILEEAAPLISIELDENEKNLGLLH